MNNQLERRRSKRISITKAVEVDDCVALRGNLQATDLSLSGVRLCGAIPLKAGNIIKLAFHGDDDEDALSPWLVAWGHVVHSQPGSEAGVQFLLLPSDQRARIERLIETL